MLIATATQINAVAGVNGDTPTEITRVDIDEVNKILMGNNAVKITGGIEGTLQFATAPIRQAFIAMAHTDMTGARGLDQIQGFQHVSTYPSSKNESKYSEWGSAAAFRFLVSSVGSKVVGGSGLGNDLYNIPCCGQESYATIHQDQYSAQFIYLPAQYSGPLALVCSLGWKMRTCPKILNDLWLANLRVTLA